MDKGLDDMSDVDDSIDARTQQVIDLLAPLGPIVAKPMLGTWGLYLEDRIFGLVHDGQVYFRTNDSTIARYVDAGSRPFVYVREGGPSSVLPYHEVPDTILDVRDDACAWAYEAAAGE